MPPLTLDTLGNVIAITAPTITGVYPIQPDFDVVRRLGNQYVTHKISLKKEQRIRRSFHSNSWAITHQTLTATEIQTLVTFYENHRHPSQLFYFYDPHETQYLGGFFDLSGASSIGRYVVRFADSVLTSDMVRSQLQSVGLEVIEVNTSETPITASSGFQYNTDRYTIGYDGGFGAIEFYCRSELTGIEDIIPMVIIRPGSVLNDRDTIGVSDRLVYGSQHFGATPTEHVGYYLPRLLDWEFTQEIGSNDGGRFVLDDADGIFTAYAKEILMARASVKFFLNAVTGYNFHNLWSGYVVSWTNSREEGTFTIECQGGMQGLQRNMPRRTGASVCPWEFNDGKECLYAAFGSGGDPDECDKGLDTPNGCAAHGMVNFFGGVNPKPQTVSGKLNDTGIFGAFRKGYTSTSTPIKSIHSEVIPIVYGDGRQIVEAKIFETRDESEFFVAAGLFSEGPIRTVGQVLLDGQTQHPGYQPIIAKGEVGQNIGTHIDPNFRSSSTAFTSVRRVDEVGFKNPNEPHSILVEVLSGVPNASVWWWTGPFVNGSRSVISSNPCHIAMNFILRSLGVHNSASPEFMQSIVDVDSFVAAAQYCDTMVPSLTGGADERRFEFRGVIKDLKPAIDHLRDILASAPIDIVYRYGKLAFKVRADEITVASPKRIVFEHLQNIIQGSFRSAIKQPRFNELKIVFSDIGLDFQENSFTAYDESAQIREGYYPDPTILPTLRKPLVRQAQLNAIGLFTKSQVTRLATQLLFEELGGATEQEQLDARDVEMSVPLLALNLEISDISVVIHPDLPGGQAYVRWNYWRLGSDWRIDLRGTTVTASMYGGPPLQLPSDSTGDSQPGIPGGSQGSGGSENTPGALIAPVLTLISEAYNTAQVGVSPAPALVNYLIVQVSADVGFSAPVESSLSPSTTAFPVAGSSGVSKWVRAKWRRTSAVTGPPAIPAEESAWSNVLVITFPKIPGSDIAGLPATQCVEPNVPLIKAVYGWTEFLEVELMSGGNIEGVKALFAGPLTSGAWPKGGLYVQNLSSDPDVAIEWVEFTMGGNSAHTAGFTSLDGDNLDPAPLVYPRRTIAAGTNIATIDTLDPGSPKEGVDYFVQFLGTAISRWVQYVLIPVSTGQPNVLVCPQDSELAANVPLAYHCDGGNGASYFAVRLQLVQFSKALRGGLVNPTIEVQIYGRSGGAYSETLGRTFYDPFLPSSPFPGHYGSFLGNVGPAGRVKVKFSTGFVFSQAVYDVPNQGAGIVLLPSDAEAYQLDDFFVFVSEAPFTATLDAISGDWWDALGALPDGVYLARVARDTNLFITNLFGTKLIAGTTYYVRVGARRFTSLCQQLPDYLYSPTLSEQMVGVIGSDSGEALAPEVPEEEPPPDTSMQMIAGTGIMLETDEEAGTVTINLDMNTVRESGGFLFFTGSTAIVGTDVCKFEVVADHDGTFKDWRLRAATAPTGSSLIVDVHKNGVSIFDNGVNRPSLAASQSSNTGQAFNVINYVKGDVFRFDMDQVGATIPGSDVCLQLNGDSPLRIV